MPLFSLGSLASAEAHRNDKMAKNRKWKHILAESAASWHQSYFAETITICYSAGTSFCEIAVLRKGDVALLDFAYGITASVLKFQASAARIS